MGKLINEKIHIKCIAYPICSKPHILLDKNIHYPESQCHSQTFSVYGHIGLWILCTKPMGKLINEKIHIKYIAYPICFKPHILLDKNIHFLESQCHSQTFSVYGHIRLWIVCTKSMEKLINVNIHMKYVAYSICFKPHILFDKNIHFLESQCHSLCPDEEWIL